MELLSRIMQIRKKECCFSI